jgi:tRNA A-37 threonylcarbamoyl transferase component Bud32
MHGGLAEFTEEAMPLETKVPAGAVRRGELPFEEMAGGHIMQPIHGLVLQSISPMEESVRSIWIVPAKSACAEEIVVGRSLRVLPGTREVSEASWRGRDVVLKVFCHRWKARCHYWRELRGLRRLAELGFRAPVLLLSGRTKQGHWAVVTEKIADAFTGLEIWRQAETVEQKVDLLCQIAAELARHHRKGVTQADLHIGNFMLRGDVVFSLDVAQMSFRGRPLRRRASIEDLAKLLSCLGDDKFWGIGAVAGAYAKERQWPWSRPDDETLRKRVRARRRKVVRKLVRSSLRTTSRTLRFRHRRFRGVFEKELTEKFSVPQFCDALDTLLREGEVLKDGNTCFVARVRWNQSDVVIKRYNHKGLWHSLRHTLKGSRARRNWLHANRLRFLGIPTARAVAYIDEWRGPLLWQSYFVMRFVAGTPVSSIFRNEETSDAQKQRIHEQIVSLLHTMAGHGISHGDMKHVNLLFDGKEVILIDLDGMQVGGMARLCRRRYQRDVDRYLRDLSGLNTISIPSQGAR